MSIIAFKGEVSLEKATWDTDWGMYAQFTLEQAPQDRLNANPFKKFTKMRKGKVGTRFSAVFNCGEDHIVYEDEVMLKGWSDGTTGWRVTLWLNADDIGQHPFMNDNKGQPYALAMVELQDDNEPVDQVKRERVEKGPRKKQGLSNYAAMLCREPRFWEYLRSIGVEYESNGPGNSPASEWMRKYLGIDSRSQLDTDPAVADQFHADIRRPYAEWVANTYGQST